MGLGQMTAVMLKQGIRFRDKVGIIHDRDSVQLSSDFAQIGSALGIEVRKHYVSFSASTLSFDQNDLRLLKLMRQVLLSPRMLVSSLGKKDFLREQAKQIESLKSLPDKGFDFLFHLFQQDLFSSSLYGRPSTGVRSTIKQIQYKDVASHYFQYYRPQNFTLVISGDVKEPLPQRNRRLPSW